MTGRFVPVVLGVAAVTLAARIVGFGRSLVFSKTVGDTCLGDAYNAANTLPNVLFEVVAGGVLASVVIPVVSRHAAAGRTREASRTVSALLTWTLLILTVPGVVAAWGAGVYAQAYAVPRCPDSASALTALLLTFVPQIWLYGLAVVSAGVLQAHHRFWAAASAPLLSSLVVVVAYAGFGGLVRRAGVSGDAALIFGPGLALLGWGTTAGVVALTATTVVPLTRLGLRLRPRLRFAAGDAPVIGRIAVAGAAGLILQQVSVLVIIHAARGTGQAGDLTRFTWANALYLLPYAVLAAPVLQLIFPRLGAAAEQGPAVLVGVLRGAVPVVILAGLLGAALLAATAVPVARTFVLGPGSGQTYALAGPIMAFAPAVLGFALLGLTTRALLAQHRARAAGAATASAWGAVIVIALIVTAAGGGVTALAGAVSGGLLIGAVVGWVLLDRTVEPPLTAALRRPLAAGLIGGVVAVGVCWWPASRLAGVGLLAAGGGALALAVLTAVVFGGIVRLLHPQIFDELARLRRGPAVVSA